MKEFLIISVFLLLCEEAVINWLYSYRYRAYVNTTVKRTEVVVSTEARVSIFTNST